MNSVIFEKSPGRTGRGSFLVSGSLWRRRRWREEREPAASNGAAGSVCVCLFIPVAVTGSGAQRALKQAENLTRVQSEQREVDGAERRVKQVGQPAQ